MTSEAGLKLVPKTNSEERESMYLATCAQRLLCVFGLGMMLTACDNTTEPTTNAPASTVTSTTMLQTLPPPTPT